MKLILPFLIAFLVAGCTATNMMPKKQSSDLQLPPNRNDFANIESYITALEQYGTYIQFQTGYIKQRYGLATATPTETNCDALELIKEYVLPEPKTITSNTLSGQLEQVLLYVDEIRYSVDTYNLILNTEKTVFSKICGIGK